ncbi:MAG: carboxypeptidase-like regulatory domain-containing protein [Vicinamibacterales bacterium]
MSARGLAGACAAMLVWVLSAGSSAAQGVGAIGGTIADASGAVLPGVMVTLSNPAGTIGANQTVATDERGAYQFIRLVPGVYRVRAELQGFRPSTQENIAVTADATARVDIRLELGGIEEGIIVSGEAPLLDTTSAMRQTVLTREILDSLPNRVDVWAAARVIPSVVLGKVDVGGSESFLQSTATVHGSSTENAYLIEGMDVSNLDGNGSQAIMYLDPYVFEETNYQMGSAGTAVSSKGGLIFNMITRTGTNRFHGGTMFNGANRSMGSANYSPELRAQLLAAVPAAALAANPNIVPGADIQKIYDSGAWLSGPVVRDHLWFSGAWHRQVLDQYLLGNYDPNGSQVLDDNLMWTTSAKASWQATRTIQLSYFNNLQYKLIGHRNGGGTFAESRARNLNDKYPDIHQVKYTQTVGNRMVLDASFNRFRADDKFGQEPEVKAGDISRFDAVTNTYTVALPTYRDLATFRDQAMGSVGFFTGRHDIRFGYQVHGSGAEVVHLVDIGDARRLPQRTARLGEHLQRADHVDVDEDPGGLRAVVPRSGALHPGQVDPAPAAHAEHRAAVGIELRLATGIVPGGDDLRAGAVLRRDRGCARLQGVRAALLGGVRHLR